MDLKAAILSRRTVHEFSDETVPRALVEEALNLALWAPNHKLTFPWMFCWIGSQTQAKLVDLAAELNAQGPKALSGIALEALRKKLLGVPRMIAVGCKKVADEFQQREDYASVACGIQNAALFLHAEGYGTKWSTGGFTRHERTYQILGMDPSEIEIVGFLFIGKGQPPAKKPLRPELNTVLLEKP